MVTLWIVLAVVVVLALAGMAAHDRRAKARGALLAGDVDGAVRRNPARGATDAQRGPN